ncbi:MAG TPA: diacylglycerol kinase family protein [Flavobacteriaceae bacterium]|nr:diacylglycerol kinase family protein [Flavobacteriaceae bacterium]
MAEESFVKNRIKSFKFAFKGAWLLLKSEASIQVQFSIGVLMTIAGFVVGITPTEWMFQCLAIGLVLSIEGLNTAVEKLADFIHPDFHHKIGFIKDIAAGAVCFAAVIAVIVGLIIYVPYLSEW